MTNSNLILLYALLSAGLAASLLLFLSLKQELKLVERHQRRRFEEIAQRLEEAEEPVAVVPQEGPRVLHSGLVHSGSVQAGFNLNKRVHAVRLMRRGEDVAHIAAALGVPRAEVELLIRVQHLSAAAAAAAAAAGGGSQAGGGA